jgi:hypothetical protein
MNAAPSALPAWMEEFPIPHAPWFKCPVQITQLGIRLSPTAYVIMTYMLEKAGMDKAAFGPSYEPAQVEVDMDLL